MDAQHMPTHWNVPQGGIVPTVCDAGGNVIAKLGDCGDVMEAHARLIAAAPELLELARLFEASVQYQIDRDTDEEGRRLKTLTVFTIRDVIAKAEGRS